jgi:Flp pilus assembly pilin Flp
MKYNSKTKSISDCKLKRTRTRRGARGQGLVEYALIFVLVSIVVIVAAAAIGTAVQRIYAIVAGGLGAQRQIVSGQDNIDINEGAQFCVLVPPNPAENFPGATVLNFAGSNQIPITELTLSTDTGLFFAGGGQSDPFRPDPGNPGAGWQVYYIVANKADAGVCPRTVVIQSQHKDLAIATVNIKVIE